MVDDIVYLLGRKLMEYRHGYGSIGECGKKCHSPVGAIASAEGYLVASLHASVFKQYVEFLYLARHIVILEGRSLVVGECVQVPIVRNALFYERVQARYFHCHTFNVHLSAPAL